MNAKINENQCTGCGICASVCPSGIEIVNGIAKIKDKDASCLSDAAKSCPRKCILIDGDNNDSEKSEENNNFNQEFGQGEGRGMGRGQGRGMGRGPRDGSGMGRGGGGRGQGRRF